MKVASRLLEHDDLGQLHVVRFSPENPNPNELGIVFNGHNARASVLPDFSMGYQLAELWNTAVDYIERPRTGSNGEIEDSVLRKENIKYGMVSAAIRGAILEAQQTEPDFKNFERFKLAGLSYGGLAAQLHGSTMTESGLHVAGEVSIDGVGNSYASRRPAEVKSMRGIPFFTVMGMLRYGSYWAGELASDKLPFSRKKKVDDMFADYNDEYEKFMDESKLDWNPVRPPRSMQVDIWHLTKATQPYGLQALEKIMENAVVQELKFDFRACYSAVRHYTDGSMFPSTRRLFDRFDKRHPDQKMVTRGFLPADKSSFWHNLIIDPKIVEELVTSPIDELELFPQG